MGVGKIGSAPRVGPWAQMGKSSNFAREDWVGPKGPRALGDPKKGPILSSSNRFMKIGNTGKS